MHVMMMERADCSWNCSRLVVGREKEEVSVYCWRTWPGVEVGAGRGDTRGNYLSKFLEKLGRRLHAKRPC